MTISIDPKIFVALCITSSNEATRFYLNGVHLCATREGGTMAVSTDGHRAGVYHMPDTPYECQNDKLDADVASLIIRNDKTIVKAATDLMNANKKQGPSLAVPMILDGDDLRIGKVTHHGVLIKDTTFPDWRRIMPKIGAESSYEAVGFNPSYVADFGKVSKILDRGEGMCLYASDGSSPMGIRLSDPNYWGVLMPMRTSITWADLPT